MADFENLDFDRVRYTLGQVPTMPYVHLLTAGLMAVALAGVVVQFMGEALVGQLIYGLAPVLIVVMFLQTERWSTPARFTLSPTTLVIEAWVGRWLPMWRRIRVPVHQVRFGWAAKRRGIGRRGEALFHLMVEAAGEEVALCWLRGTPEEIGTLEEALRSMATHADARHGEGREEVPPWLRAVARASQPAGRSPKVHRQGESGPPRSG